MEWHTNLYISGLFLKTGPGHSKPHPSPKHPFSTVIPERAPSLRSAHEKMSLWMIRYIIKDMAL